MSEVTQLCQTLCHAMDCSLPGSSVHGSFPSKRGQMPSSPAAWQDPERSPVLWGRPPVGSLG